MVLQVVAERQEEAGHGWALDQNLRPVMQRVFNLAARGLVELAGREDRAGLSAWEGRAVLWPARPSPCAMTFSSTAVCVLSPSWRNLTRGCAGGS